MRSPGISFPLRGLDSRRSAWLMTVVSGLTVQKMSGPAKPPTLEGGARSFCAMIAAWHPKSEAHLRDSITHSDPKSNYPKIPHRFRRIVASLRHASEKIRMARRDPEARQGGPLMSGK